jgi:ABC-type uncharacterized transport system permease subunit
MIPGLAAMIFGRWNPVKAFASSLIFGFADSLQVKLQTKRGPIPSEFLLMIPYSVTMINLTINNASIPTRDLSPQSRSDHSSYHSFLQE